MEPDAKYTLVGAAALVALAALVGWILWLTRGRTSEDVNRYMVYFRKQSLSGLAPDSWVTMRGIRVGSVETIHIDEQDPQAVKVVLRVDREAPVKTDTQAVIMRQLLTGLASIDLVGGSQQANPLVAAPPGERFPLIPEGKSTLDVLQSSIPGVADEATELLHRTRDVLSDENRRHLHTILANFAVLSESLASRRDKLGHAVDEGAASLEAIHHLAADLRAAVPRVVDSVQSAVQVISRESISASRNLGRVSQSVARSAQTFEDPRTALFGPSPKARGPGE